MAGSLEMLLHDASLLKQGGDEAYMLIENMGDAKEAIVDTADEIARLQARVEALEGAIKSAHNDLMNLQPHIPQSCYPKHQPFIDTHVDAAMETLAATEQGESDG